jgi:hypothetical protein
MERKDVKKELPDKVKEYHKKYNAEYSKANRAKIKARQAKRYQENKKVDKVTKYKKYLEDN